MEVLDFVDFVGFPTLERSRIAESSGKIAYRIVLPIFVKYVHRSATKGRMKFVVGQGSLNLALLLIQNY